MECDVGKRSFLRPFSVLFAPASKKFCILGEKCFSSRVGECAVSLEIRRGMPNEIMWKSKNVSDFL